MTRYHIDELDLDEANSSHSLVAELVGDGKDVLDVGCATGYLGQALGSLGCRVVGIEVDPVSAAEARERLAEVLEADIDGVPLDEVVGDRRFDVVVLADVLEHLVRPEVLLSSVARVLRPGGVVVASVPNVTHGSLRLALLQGRWDYRDTGLLDRTHLRFYSRTSLVALFAECGFTVTDLRATVLDALGSEVEVDADDLPPGVVRWVREQDDAASYQFVLRAVPGAAAPPPELVPAVAVPRPDDRFTARGELSSLQTPTDDVTELRRRVLTLRDHAIGAEASVGTMRARLAERQIELADTRAELALCREEVVQVHARLRGVLDELEATRASSTWRVGSFATRPLHYLRRVSGRRGTSA
ncbi:class I SAM-dependent methyltransferase [Cellulomonas telluris]|uniref:class I SAM-dependent methyltransferase n=1 Tax=Cellulomonas telluris TaxID=2306636 RepID=UPI0014562892|nr:class I SAM-dependent methyltransferase [Cellulomonas telluris]